MILAALEGDTAGIVLTNNISPPSTIISKAEQLGVPMLLVPDDTPAALARLLEDAVSRDCPSEHRVTISGSSMAGTWASLPLLERRRRPPHGSGAAGPAVAGQKAR